MVDRKDDDVPKSEKTSDKTNEPKRRGPGKDLQKPPPAGPHADPSLTNDEATPGAGTLPPPDGEPNGGGSVSS